MRINKYIATHSHISRRSADKLIEAGRVRVNNQTARIGQLIELHDTIAIDDKPLKAHAETITIALHKPIGYVCSRRGQGAPTIFELLPAHLQSLQPAGRLDKDSSGLLMLSNDGDLLQQLSHPRFNKPKTYEVTLDKPLTATDEKRIKQGVQLEDGLSHMNISTKSKRTRLEVTLREGRNRQIRRTFQAIGYRVRSLHRTTVDTVQLDSLQPGSWQKINLDKTPGQ